MDEAERMCGNILNKPPNLRLRRATTTIKDGKRRRDICDVGTRSRPPTKPASPQSQRKRYCGNCGKRGHYAKTCKSPSAEFGLHAPDDLDSELPPRLWNNTKRSRGEPVAVMSIYTSLEQPLGGLATLDLSGNDTLVLQFEAPNDVGVCQVAVRHGPDLAEPDYTNDGEQAAVLEAFSRISEVSCRSNHPPEAKQRDSSCPGRIWLYWCCNQFSRTQIHDINATGKVALNPIIQNSAG
ncbi:hypothetical protein B0H14DRAFT_3663864 [Mycena olivaceomarginata]|nr:hypothetical protein B0H14DRAFT_3663864 [Mycena olivaceomarginata]